MFAVLHIADFALHAVLRTEPASSRPAALFAGTSRKSIVLAANSAARSAGVELGMTAPQAVARCPALVIRSPQAAADAEAHTALLAIGFTLSPSIEDTAPGVCTVDLRGTTPEKFQPATHDAIGKLDQLGLPATAGIAATPLLALYAARAVIARSRSSSSFSFSPSSTDGSPYKPGRTRTTNENDERAKILHVTDPAAFLAPLPLAAADPPPELAGVLAQWGLRTLGDLTALPRDEIVRRFGAGGLAFWQRAAGGAPRPLHPVTPPQVFAAALEFEDEIETLEPLLFILRRFLDRLTLELHASQYLAAEIALTLKLANSTVHQRDFRLPEPTAEVEILFRTLHTHLESLTTVAPIVAVSLQLTPARPLVRQQGLFETGLRDPHGFAETLSRAGALVGPARAGTPRCEDTHRPDAVTLISPPAVVPPPAGPALYPPLGTPLRRFRPPLPARIELTDGRATYLWTNHVQGEIAHQSVEWPSSGDWWQRDRAWARSEWDIALADGGLYRLLLVGGSYFLEGEYD